MRIGVVSDTHRKFHPALPQVLAGVDRILHAGDICAEEVVRRLAEIAPVVAIRGNCDERLETERYPAHVLTQVGLLRALIVHDLGKPERPRPEAEALIARERPDIVISGHTHVGHLTVRDGVVYVNPGSAGPRRFRLVPSVARLRVDGRKLQAELLLLEPVGVEPVSRIELDLA